MKCEVPEQSDIPATWHYYDGLIKKNRKIASIASSIKEYAPKRGLVEDITEQQDEKDSDGKDVSNKDVDQHYIPHHLIFTHKDDLLDCEVSSSEPSLHTRLTMCVIPSKRIVKCGGMIWNMTS